MIRFTRIDGEQRGAKHVAKKLPILLGRAPDADIRLNPHQDLDASARHAEIFLHEGAPFIRDLGSRNGSYLNGRRLGDPARLQSGDEVELGYGGPRFRLYIEIDGVEALTPPAVKSDEGDSVDEMAATVAFPPEEMRLVPKADEREDEDGVETLIMDGALRDALLEDAQARDKERMRRSSLPPGATRSEAAETLFVDAIKEREELAHLERENRRLRAKTVALSLFLAVSILLSWLVFSR